MYRYRTPGVYFEWLDAQPRAIPRLRTDVAGFVGIAARGPLHEAVRVASWTQFTSVFGGHIPQGYLAYAVEGFFANGGDVCWVVRLADAKRTRRSRLLLYDARGVKTLQVLARTPGVWGDEVVVTVGGVGAGRFTLTIRPPERGVELFRGLSLDPDDARYVEHVLDDPEAGSRLITAEDLDRGHDTAARVPSPRAQNLTFGSARLAGGGDGLQSLTPAHVTGIGAPPDRRWGLAVLDEIDEVAVLAVPDAMTKPRVTVRRAPPRPPRCEDLDPPSEPPRHEPAPPEYPRPFSDEELVAIQLATIAQCELRKDRIAVLDARLEDSTPDRVSDWRRSFDTSYGALYHPWLLVPDPLQLTGPLRAVPPSGHVAGVYARVDREAGVHKPPANELLELGYDVSAATGDIAHGDLNDAGVNVIRAFPGRGLRVAGARTLSSDRTWLYVNVRRLLMMIEEAIDEGTQWAVFEPGDPTLWREIDRVATTFLDTLWRNGMLDGATAEEAYFVRCDETTNPPEEIELGRTICLVGVQPPWPAEFVVVRIGKTESGSQILEPAGVTGA